jgi:hypothetical protein
MVLVEDAMTYVILIIGFALIYLSLRKDKENSIKDDNKSENRNLFNNLLTERIDSSRIDIIEDRINNIEMRLEEIEKSMLLLQNEEIFKDENNIIQDDKEGNSAVDLNDNKEASEHLDRKAEKVEDINEMIFGLYNQGKTIDDIASILKIGKGEVSLRLELRKQKK